MPMRWIATTGFPQKPYVCVACGQAPMKEDATPEEAYTLEGSDVNWGDTLQLCCSCVRVVGELHGMLEPEKVSLLKKEIRELKGQLEEAQGERDEYETLNSRMLEGAKARKRSKEKNVANAA